MDLDKLKDQIIKADINVSMTIEEAGASLSSLLSSDMSQNCFLSIRRGCGFSGCPESCANGCSLGGAQS